jgi:hypothetical protein
LGVLSNLHCQSLSLARRSSVNAFLHNTAAMLVAGNINTFVNHGIIYELVVLWYPCEEYLLYYVISIDVLS